MHPIVLYALVSQPENPRSKRDGVVVKRRSRRPARRNASRSFL
jgi:hypothetical protein